MSSGTTTVVSCAKLKDTEWISRQDPYACLEYASTKFRTRTCTDGGKHLVFQEKFVVPLIEGLREFTVVVWNSDILTFDGFIVTGKVQLNKVLSQGFDDSSWQLQTKSGRHAGEVKLILHSANAKLNQQKLDSSSTHVATTPTAPSSSSFLKPPFKLLLTFSATHYTPFISPCKLQHQRTYHHHHHQTTSVHYHPRCKHPFFFIINLPTLLSSSSNSISATTLRQLPISTTISISSLHTLPFTSP
ncbi:hypothetical protein RYX36_006067 [Vicia faba]